MGKRDLEDENVLEPKSILLGAASPANDPVLCSIIFSPLSNRDTDNCQSDVLGMYPYLCVGRPRDPSQGLNLVTPSVVCTRNAQAAFIISHMPFKCICVPL